MDTFQIVFLVIISLTSLMAGEFARGVTNRFGENSPSWLHRYFYKAVDNIEYNFFAGIMSLFFSITSPAGLVLLYHMNKTGENHDEFSAIGGVFCVMFFIFVNMFGCKIMGFDGQIVYLLIPYATFIMGYFRSFYLYRSGYQKVSNN